MKTGLGIVTTLGLAALGGAAMAEGQLNIFNWAGYTPPDVVERFEKETGIDVTMDTYDSNETLLAKLQAGGGDFDIIVAGHSFVPLMVGEKLVQTVKLSEMENYGNLKPEFINPSYDPEGEFTAPYQGGSTAFMVDTAVYDKPIDSYEILFNPPPELEGKIGMLKSAPDVVMLAAQYLDLPFCSDDPATLQQVLDLLMEQKPA
ncbi:MAG: extracellular solute-binding protein, partial [Pikeienuella sp.]